MELSNLATGIAISTIFVMDLIILSIVLRIFLKIHKGE
jgi:hypothetical protein